MNTAPVAIPSVSNPRKRLRRRSLIWIATATLGLLIVNDWGLRYAARANPSSRVNWLFHSAPTHYAIAILGSSMSKEGVDPDFLSDLTDRQSVQLAWGGRGVSEQALYWELFLERHQCDLLLLELHPRGLEYGVLPHPLDEFRYISRLDHPVVQRHLNRHSGWIQTQAWRFIPMVAMAQFSTQIGWHDVLAWRKRVAFNPNTIHASTKQSALETDPKPESNRTLQLLIQRYAPDRLAGAASENPDSIKQFQEILALCHSKGVQVVAFAPPMFQDNLATPGSLARYQELLGPAVPIFSSQADYLSDPRAFADAFHVNARGRQAYTAELAQFINNILRSP